MRCRIPTISLDHFYFMNYQKIYDAIIQKARLEKREKGKSIYYEAHHIIPKCLGGEGTYQQWKTHPNIVLLTAREHYICHILLHQIYPENIKLMYAIYAMSKQTTNKMERKINNSVIYETIKSKIANLGVSEEVRKKISISVSKTMTGVKLKEEHKYKIKIAHLGKPKSENHKKNISKATTYGNHPSAKPVSQYDLLGNFIRNWSCASEAAKNMNIHSSGVGQCCLGKLKTSGGYIWKFYYEK